MYNVYLSNNVYCIYMYICLLMYNVSVMYICLIMYNVSIMYICLIMYNNQCCPIYQRKQHQCVTKCSRDLQPRQFRQHDQTRRNLLSPKFRQPVKLELINPQV